MYLTRFARPGAAAALALAAAAPALAESTTWTAAQGTSWQNPGNWTNGVPAGDMDALILRRGLSGGVQLSGAATHTGLTVLERELVLSGLGRIVNSTVEVRESGDLRFQVSPAANPAVADVIDLRGGVVRAGEAATAGGLRLGDRASQFFSTFHPLTVGRVERQPGATLALNPRLTDRPDIGRIRVIEPMDLSGSGTAPDRLAVAPWITADTSAGPAFVTLDRSNSNFALRPLDAATEYATSLVAGANVRLTGDTVAPDDVAVNTLTLSGSSVAIAAGRTLALAGGGLLLDPAAGKSGSISGGGSLALPTTEGVVYAFNQRTANPIELSYAIDVPVSGGTLTKAGDATLVLSKPNSYSGGTVINEGAVELAVPGAVGSGPIRLSGGGIRIGYANGEVANDIVVNAERTRGFIVPQGTTVLSGNLSGTGTLAFGGGDVRLIGGGAAQGAYRVSATAGGNLIVDGNLQSPDGIVTFANASLFGNGTVRGQVFADFGTLSPGPAGEAPGRLTVGFGDLYYSTLHVDLDGPVPGIEYDQLVVLDRFRLTGAEANSLEVRLAGGFRPEVGQSFTIIDNRFAGPMDGTFTNLGGGEGAVFEVGGTSFRITYAGGDGNDVVLTVVPEPAGIGTMATAGMVLLRRRRRGSSQE